MTAAGVPVVPGMNEPEADPERARAFAREIGYPVMIKAAAGGGGKGMRRVDEDAGFLAAFAGASREAMGAFGDERVYVEKYLEKPRHVEIQVFADKHGNAIHLFERECSVQRKHQKVVEETPSPIVTPEMRAAMGEVAVKAARAVGYVGAGTVEFLVDAHRNFYFLEMNTRLQVEHPITEETLGLDLVRAQIEIAAGAPLPPAWRGGKLVPQGHAIELRLYAEDPFEFLPRTGRILAWEEPSGPGIRVDAGVGEGSEVGVDYDPLLAKLVVSAPDRDAAIRRLIRAARCRSRPAASRARAPFVPPPRARAAPAGSAASRA
jgi:acetyl-CoA carboxylase biotin carboxylase subunit